MPLLSIIIPFMGEEEKIKKLLEALLKQADEISEDVEIIVIDNNKQQQLKQISAVKVFHETIPGSYAARNLGVRKARGSYLFFTDSDCIPSENWLKMGLIRIKESGGIVAGRIELQFTKEQSPRPLELYERVFYFQQDAYIKKEGYGATANLIVEKSVFDRHGLFDSALRSGGDQEFCQRMVKKGVPLIYDEKVLVYHPSRSSWRDFIIRRVRALSGNIFLLYRSRGFTWTQLREKLPYYLDQNKMMEWNADWDYYHGLNKEEKKSIRRCHRILTLVDIMVLVGSKLSYRLMKYFTMIDRHLN